MLPRSQFVLYTVERRRPLVRAERVQVFRTTERTVRSEESGSVDLQAGSTELKTFAIHVVRRIPESLQGSKEL